MRVDRVSRERVEGLLAERLGGLERDVAAGLEAPRDDSPEQHGWAGSSAGHAMSVHREIVSLMFERGDAVADIAGWWDEHVDVVNELAAYRASLSPTEFMRADWSVLTLFETWCAMSGVGWSALLIGGGDSRTVRMAELVGSGLNRVVDRFLELVEPGRVVADEVRNERPYANLLKALEAEPDKRAGLISRFVKVWYDQSRKQPWWSSHTRVPHMYSGYWCVEAAAVCVLQGVDDAAVRDNEFYPTDLADYARAQGYGTS